MPRASLIPVPEAWMKLDEVQSVIDKIKAQFSIGVRDQQHWSDLSDELRLAGRRLDAIGRGKMR